MFVPEKMRINKFRNVHIPSNKKLFGNVKNLTEVNIHNSDNDVNIPDNMNKADFLAWMDSYDRYMQEKENSANDGGTETTSSGDKESHTDD